MRRRRVLQSDLELTGQLSTLSGVELRRLADAFQFDLQVVGHHLRIIGHVSARFVDDGTHFGLQRLLQHTAITIHRIEQPAVGVEVRAGPALRCRRLATPRTCMAGSGFPSSACRSAMRTMAAGLGVGGIRLECFFGQSPCFLGVARCQGDATQPVQALGVFAEHAANFIQALRAESRQRHAAVAGWPTARAVPETQNRNSVPMA